MQLLGQRRGVYLIVRQQARGQINAELVLRVDINDFCEILSYRPRIHIS